MSQAVLPLLELELPIAVGRVVALFLKPAHGVIEPVKALTAVGGKGFEGDYSFGKRKRQALFLSTENLDEFGYAPGVLREQITVDIPGLQSLPAGTRVLVGDVEFEIESDCPPCGGMARKLGENPREWMARLAFKRGMLAKVRSSGEIRVGDRVIVLRG